MTAPLDAIRAEIDALDTDLRQLLLARAELVAKVALAKKAETNIAAPPASPMRPMREMQQMAALLAWHEKHAPQLTAEGLIAIWREIIGMALAQQGGMTIYTAPDAMAAARAHFGASLTYETHSDPLAALAAAKNALAVLPLAAAVRPPADISVVARLPVLGSAAALCYAASDETPDAGVALVARAAALNGDRVLHRAADFVLVETDDPQNDPLWGRYGTLDGAPESDAGEKP